MHLAFAHQNTTISLPYMTSPVCHATDLTPGVDAATPTHIGRQRRAAVVAQWRIGHLARLGVHAAFYNRDRPPAQRCKREPGCKRYSRAHSGCRPHTTMITTLAARATPLAAQRQARGRGLGRPFVAPCRRPLIVRATKVGLRAADRAGVWLGRACGAAAAAAACSSFRSCLRPLAPSPPGAAR